MLSYDKKNNDTYIEKYSNNMATDVEVHMFKDDKASTVAFGIRGHFNVESAQIAQNNVLHFEPAKSLGKEFVLIKNKNKSSLVPLSLMKRYEKKVFDITYTQKTPIFFNVETEKFVCTLDNRILRDLKEIASFEEKLKQLHSDVSVMSNKNGNQVLLSYDSLEELYTDKSGISKQVRELYLKTLLTHYPGEDVIVLKYSMDENKTGYFYPTGSYPPVILENGIPGHIFSSANIEFEFVKARKVSDTYFYFYDNEGQLSITKPLSLDKEHLKKAQLPENKNKMDYVLSQNKKQMVIIAYSQKDWDILSNLKEKIDSIFSDLDKLLLKQKNNSGLDKPVTQIDFSNYLTISHSPKVKP